MEFILNDPLLLGTIIVSICVLSAVLVKIFGWRVFFDILRIILQVTLMVATKGKFKGGSFSGGGTSRKF